MRTVGMYEARTKFAELIDHVSSGETIIVTRNGKAIAELRPVSAVRALDSIVDEIVTLEWTSGEPIVDTIREAREERG